MAAKNLCSEDVLAMLDAASDVESESETDGAKESDESDCGAGTNSERDRDASRSQETLDTARDGAGTNSECDRGAVRESIDTAGVSGEDISAAAGVSGEEGVTSEESESDNSDNEAPKSRKGVRRPNKWQKNKRVQRRNSGKCYTSATGKQVMLIYTHCTTYLPFLLLLQVNARTPDNNPCNCALRCYDKLTQEERKSIFDAFWATASFDVQNDYLCGCVKSLPVSRRYSPHGSHSRRQCTRVCYVTTGSVSVRICKKAFLKIHSVSNGRLDRALRPHQTGGRSPHCDQRGKHEPGNKTRKEIVDNIKAHIALFP